MRFTYLFLFTLACAQTTNSSNNTKGDSDLPYKISCNTPALHQCTEFYRNFEVHDGNQCGLGKPTEACVLGSDYVGSCSTSYDAGGGYKIQTVTLYYQDGNNNTLEAVQKRCELANGTFTI